MPTNTHVHLHSYECTLRKLYSYEHLQKNKPTDLKADEVTVVVSLSMDTSITTKRMGSLNPEIIF